MRTLIVDDDPVCRAVLQHALMAYGPISFADNGVEAIAAVAAQLAKGEPFDLVTLDIMMPDMDGHQTLKAIRRLEVLFKVGHDVKVAVTSAMGDKDSIFASFREQADLYFVKPIRLDQLMDELRTHQLIAVRA
ncbi:MAG: response regulator [Planctomycetes bacterium]|nr:response regulator [Planctomycetota bacterium]